MAKREGSEYVTHREFYAALVAVWLYIMLIISKDFEVGAKQWTWAYFAGSLFAIVAYAIMTIRSSGRRAGREPDSEASDKTVS